MYWTFIPTNPKTISAKLIYFLYFASPFILHEGFISYEFVIIIIMIKT